MKVKYYSELDGVRGIAAFMVMILHFFQHKEYANTFGSYTSKLSILGTGVDLFFVLSGFLITRILIATKSSNTFFSTFYIRRSLRIFPLYYFFLILSFYFVPFLQNADFPEIKQQAYHLLYLQNFAMTFNWDYFGPGHFWSLAVEEHFYLFWPVLIFYCNKRQILFSIVAIIFMSLAMRIVMVNRGLEVFYFTFTRIDSIAVGGLLALMELEGYLKPKNAKKFILLSLFVLGPTAIVWLFFGGAGNTQVQMLKTLFISLLYLFFIGFVVSSKEENFVKASLNSKPLQYLGRISYGLYVYHPLCFYLSFTYLKSPNVVTDICISFLASIGFASLSYYLLENKILKLKKYFDYKGKGSTPAKAVATDLVASLSQNR